MPRTSTIDKTVAEIATTPEEAAIAEARARDDERWDEPYEEIEQLPDGPVTPEAMAAEAAARARMGLGGALGDDERRPPMGTTYDAKGEAIDVEAVRSARAQEAEATGYLEPGRATITQIEMPGFEGQQASKVQINFGGPIVLDLGLPGHKALWDALKWQGHAELAVTVYVADKMFKGRADATAVAALKVLKASLIGAGDDSEAPDEDGPLDDADGPGEFGTAEDSSVVGSALAQSLAEAGDDEDAEPGAE